MLGARAGFWAGVRWASSVALRRQPTRPPKSRTDARKPLRIRWVKTNTDPSAWDPAADIKRLPLPPASQRPKPKRRSRLKRPPEKTVKSSSRRSIGSESGSGNQEPDGDRALPPLRRRRRPLRHALLRMRARQAGLPQHPPSPARALNDYLARKAGLRRNLEPLSRFLSKKSDRLPILTASALLKQRLAQGELADFETELLLAAGDGDWSIWTEKRVTAGVSEDDVNHWAWILSAETADLTIERFVSDDRLKPPFLITMIVGPDRILQDPEIFVSLLQYIRNRYVGTHRGPDGCTSFDLTWQHFQNVLERLVSQCLSSWPALLPSVAQLAVSIIKGLPQQLGGSPRRAIAIQCKLLNVCLELFGSPPDVYPLNDMINNWNAQKVLLDLSSRLEPPLFLTREGYRAIRSVLVALPKSSSERETTRRASPTWPPFRQDFDGRDEQRRPEDDLSLAAKVGILKREAGYPNDHFDRGLDTVAGSVVGRTPTIQTRSLVTPVWEGNRASQNVDFEWAMSVKATRNAREAWRMFSSPPLPGMKPSAQVYAEMFTKLFADQVPEWTRMLPGDGIATFPVHDGNLTALEIARISPPAPSELYQMMLFSGVKPTGEALIVLVRHASSKQQALRYLAASPYKPHVELLQGTIFKGERYASLLSTLPPRLLYAWIMMLCRTQIKRQKRMDFTFSSNQMKEAMRLTSEYQMAIGGSQFTDKAPWYIVMGYLAGRGHAYADEGAKYNSLVTLGLFMYHWQRTADFKGIDAKLFELLCIIVRKALRLSTWQSTTGELALRVMPIDKNGRLTRLLVHALRQLKDAFSTLTQPIRALDGTPEFNEGLVYPHRLASKHIALYMKALGTLGDGEEMARLMRWILDSWDRDYVLDDSKLPGMPAYDTMIGAIAYFFRVGAHLVEPVIMRELEDNLEKLQREKYCTWFLPLDNNIVPDNEVDLDLGAAELWAHVRATVYGNGDGVGDNNTPSDSDDAQPTQLDVAEQVSKDEPGVDSAIYVHDTYLIGSRNGL
ncbi:hypothetical protein B0T14DRAFT_488536 [Immersiella caudata]|uniref:Uncharacterized protein n=1 Tax=Immersiella caudata TaxID=314043 RepID=A0AA39T1Q8_9PEZI|nr:hypothetical protein B0T14DRAFT_488536 [Immersiella caudata]